MAYVVLKTLHVLSVTLFFGAGLASVLVKLHADRSGDPRVIAFAQHRPGSVRAAARSPL